MSTRTFHMNARSLLVSAGVLGAVLLAGCPKPVEPVQPPAAPDIVEFKASKTDALPGETVTLSWSVKDAESLSLEQLGAGPVVAAPAAEGQQDVTLGEADTVYVLVARGPGGSDSRAVRVKVGAQEPLVMLAAVPAQVRAGETSTLVYSAPTADGLRLLDEAGAPLALEPGATGTLEISPRFTSRYTLEAAGKVAETSVTVAPGIVALEAKHLAARPGTVRIRWSAGGADVLKLEAAGRGELVPGASQVSRGTIAEGSFDDEVPAGLAPDSQLQYTLTVGEGDAAVQRTVTVRVGGTPAIDSFTAPTWALASGQAELRWRTRGAVRAEIWQGETQLFEASSLPLIQSGSHFVNSPAERTAYELRVYDAEGIMAKAEASTEPVGDVALVDFKADKTALTAGGEAVTLSWEVTNARRMRIVANGTGTNPPLLHVIHEAEGLDAQKGSVTVYPNAATTNYVLTADNSVGSSIQAQTQTVTVTTFAGVQTWPEMAPLGSSTGLAEAQVAGNELNAVGYEGFPNVVKNAPEAFFVDIREIGTPVPFAAAADDNRVNAVLPERFTTVSFGKRLQNQTNVGISMNGWFSFQTGSGGGYGPDDNVFGMPSSSLDNHAIAPYFADLRMTPEAEVDVAIVGLGQDRRVVVQWSDVELESAPGSRLTFQAQVYNSGRTVFAYQKLDRVPDARPTVGIQNENATVAALAPDTPRSGDAYTFFGPTQTPGAYPLPSSSSQPYLGRLLMADGGFIEINARPPTLAKDQFFVTEVNFGSGEGVTDGEWIEVTNATATQLNLRGFSIDFGPGQRHRIQTDVILPANGQVLLAQAEGANDGLAVDYVYGPSFTMDDREGAVSINSGDAVYATLAWAYGQHGGPGVSYRLERKQAASSGWIYDSSATGITCPGTTSYGTHGQLGTPKLPDTGCFPYVKSQPLEGGFESIKGFGNPITVPETWERGWVETVTLPFPIRVGFRTSTTVYVSSNGFLALDPLECKYSSSGCYYSNPTSIYATALPHGTLAVFWDALSHSTTSPTMFWEARLGADGLAGTSDDSVLVSWENANVYMSPTTKGFESDLNFQVLLTATGDIEYRYGTMYSYLPTGTTGPNYAKGSSATIWLEEPNGAGAILHSKSLTPGIQPNKTLRFSWQP